VLFWAHSENNILFLINMKKKAKKVVRKAKKTTKRTAKKRTGAKKRR
jgi:hypothetical protein